MAAFCHNCGAPLPAGARFCRACGAVQEDAAASAAPESPVAPAPTTDANATSTSAAPESLVASAPATDANATSGAGDHPTEVWDASEDAPTEIHDDLWADPVDGVDAPAPLPPVDAPTPLPPVDAWEAPTTVGEPEWDIDPSLLNPAEGDVTRRFDAPLRPAPAGAPLAGDPYAARASDPHIAVPVDDDGAAPRGALGGRLPLIGAVLGGGLIAALIVTAIVVLIRHEQKNDAPKKAAVTTPARTDPRVVGPGAAKNPASGGVDATGGTESDAQAKTKADASGAAAAVDTLTVTQQSLDGYDVSLPDGWSTIQGDVDQPAPEGITRRRTEMTRGPLRLVIDHLQNFGIPAEANRASLITGAPKQYPGYVTIGTSELDFDGNPVYEWRYSHLDDTGRRVRKVNLLFDIENDSFAVMASGRGAAADYDQLESVAQAVGSTISVGYTDGE